MLRARLAAFVVILAACKSDKDGTVALVTGQETDVFTRAPAPTTLVVEALDVDGKATELSRSALPGGDIELGDHDDSDIAALRVRALDATNRVVVSGESLLFQYGALADGTLPIFVQRTGELARMPGPDPAAFEAPLVDVLLGRYVLLVKGTQTSIYDAQLLRALSTPPTFKRTAASLTSSGTTALLVDSAGASSFDLSTGSEVDVGAPDGGTYAEVAGGATVRTKDGGSYVVGATRDPAAGATSRVLHLDKDGKLSWVSLANPRAGACATYVEGRGLVVYGGSPTAPGGEVLADGATVASALALPPDAVIGCGVAGIDGGKVVVAGGKGAAGDMGAGLPARAFDLTCAGNCVGASLPGMPIPLVRADAINVAPDAVLVGGDDATGATRVFRVSVTESHEVPLKIGRRGGRLRPLPAHFLGIVGGAATIESYRE